jgi:hypothetical protein
MRSVALLLCGNLTFGLRLDVKPIESVYASCHLLASANCGFDEGEAWHRMPTVIHVNRRVEA